MVRRIGEYTKLIFIVLIMITCTDPAPDEVEDLYPQEQIPWPSLADTPWPMVRHDPQGTSRSNDMGVTSIQGVALVLSNNYYESSIVLDNNDGMLRLGTLDGSTFLEHFNTTDEVDWDLMIEESGEIVFGPTQAENNRIYIAGRKSIFAVDIQAREIIWEYRNFDWTASNVTVGLSGELYYFVSGPLSLVSLTGEGDLRWIHQNSIHTTNSISPIVISPDGEQLYFSSGEDITCISTAGEVMWKYPTNNSYIDGQMVDNDGNLYYYSRNDGAFFCITSEGELRWQISKESLGLQEGGSGYRPTIDFQGNLYYSAKDTLEGSGIISLSNEGSKRWFYPVLSRVDLASDANNTVYYGHSSGQIHHTVGAISVNGDIIWSFEISDIFGHLYNEPVITSDGAILFPLDHTFGHHVIKVF